MSVLDHTTRLFREAAEASERVRIQLGSNRTLVGALVRELKRAPPRAIVTCARGSSDHAATFARYLIETRLGLLTASAPPSVSSVYAAPPDLRETLLLAISQSGASPDLLAAADAARASGARVLALVNVERSPLAQRADYVLPLHAGEETSVAATKSFIASLSAILDVVAEWSAAGDLRAALEAVPGQLSRAWSLDWSAAVPHLQQAPSLFVVGRGLGLAVAQEAALKLKESCALHAEAQSGAELKHGPMALVRTGFPTLLFAQDDETRAGMVALAAELAAKGASVLLAGAEHPRALCLPTLSAHAAVSPMLLAQSLYRLVDLLARTRGLDPDRPAHLRKVTETV